MPQDIRNMKPARHYPPLLARICQLSRLMWCLAKMLRGIEDDERNSNVDLFLDEDRDATRVPVLRWLIIPVSFRALTGALALVGANIVDARS